MRGAEAAELIVDGVRTALRDLGPSVGLFLSILIMVSPLAPVVGDARVLLPLLPLIVVFLYTVYVPSALPPSVLFGAGLIYDFLDGRVIGLWAVTFLSTKLLVTSQRGYLRGRPWHVLWVLFGFALILIASGFWLAQSVFVLRWLNPLPLLYQFFTTWMVYPLLVHAFFYLRRRAGYVGLENVPR